MLASANWCTWRKYPKGYRNSIEIRYWGTELAYIEKRPGKNKTSYRASIVIKSGGKIVHRERKSFDRRRDADRWGTKREKELKQALAAGSEEFQEATDPDEVVAPVPTLGELIDQYATAYAESFGRTVGRDLDLLKRSKLAQLRAGSSKSTDIVAHIAERRAGKRGPGDSWVVAPVVAATATNDLIRLQSVFDSAWASFGVQMPMEELGRARIECRKRKLIGKSKERERVASDEELKHLTDHFSIGVRAEIPMADIVWFAVHSCRRQGEITQLRWADNDAEKLTGVVPRLKDPSGARIDVPFRYTQEAWDIVQRQPHTDSLIFPHNSKSISSSFTQACKVLGIEDLTFHDLRHTAVTRLFLKGYQVHEVPAFSLHRSWASLRRYTNIKPEEVELR